MVGLRLEMLRLSFLTIHRSFPIYLFAYSPSFFFFPLQVAASIAASIALYCRFWLPFCTASQSVPDYSGKQQIHRRGAEVRRERLKLLDKIYRINRNRLFLSHESLVDLVEFCSSLCALCVSAMVDYASLR